ncbi:MAG: hypothetical protein H7246_23315 [Phycisphaerae bacterium]|nr:hypothetical protein [Saprospiraceae bacterium]
MEPPCVASECGCCRAGCSPPSPRASSRGAGTPRPASPAAWDMQKYLYNTAKAGGKVYA